MNYEAELRYYEILFIRTIHQFHQTYKMSELTRFLELASILADVDLMLVKSAMQEVLTNGPSNRINRDEYILCLKLFSGHTDVRIREIIKCSPNTIKNAYTAYENGDLYVTHKLPITQSNAVRIMMKKLREVASIY